MKFALTIFSHCTMSNELPCADKNCTDPNQHGRDSVVEFEHPVVDGDLVRLYQGRDCLCEGCDEQVCHASFKPLQSCGFVLYLNQVPKREVNGKRMSHYKSENRYRRLPLRKLVQIKQ